MSAYKTITVQELVDYINNNPKLFKDGMNTQIFTGDFEGNYTHINHEVMTDTYENKAVLFLGYEMHEDYGE